MMGKAIFSNTLSGTGVGPGAKRYDFILTSFFSLTGNIQFHNQIIINALFTINILPKQLQTTLTLI